MLSYSLFPGFPSRCVTNSDPCPVYLGPIYRSPRDMPPQEGGEDEREKRWWLLRLLADLRAQRRSPSAWGGRAVP
jgi:hypothetical protein